MKYGGTLDEATGKPLYFTWQGAEKTYADLASDPSPGNYFNRYIKDRFS